LLTLVYPEVQTDILKTMIDHVENGGELPFWELAADETYVMNGDPAPIVIADSYVKGLQDFDLGKAFEAMKQSALDTVQNRVRPMQKYFSRHGFIPVDDCGPDDRWGKPRMVSECLEYAYSDWAIAQMAKELNRDSLAHYLENRSKAYQYYFNPEIDLLQPRYSNMEWYEPFYPESYKGSWSNLGFVEGNSWQYSFFVPHDIEGLMEKMGGAENYIEQLQKCFDEKNFTIDNEPDIAYPYLFNYVPDEAWRGQKQIAEYRSHEFGNGPGGLPGNDDAGTISAWYVFSALGFYPDCPGKPTYQMGTPVFERAVIRLNPDFYMGEKFEIVSENQNSDNWKIQETKLNGYPYPNTYITHNEITDGGVLTFVFSD
jgi:predicted alpha-1,2-mannosidase